MPVLFFYSTLANKQVKVSPVGDPDMLSEIGPSIWEITRTNAYSLNLSPKQYSGTQCTWSLTMAAMTLCPDSRVQEKQQSVFAVHCALRGMHRNVNKLRPCEAKQRELRLNLQIGASPTLRKKMSQDWVSS